MEDANLSETLSACCLMYTYDTVLHSSIAQSVEQPCSECQQNVQTLRCMPSVQDLALWLPLAILKSC